MELDLGLKITRDADYRSCTAFHIAKDRAGPVFVSTETDSVFILSAHLKGFEKEDIKININEDGTRMSISGEKLVSETIMSGWRVYKREEEVKGFRKTFRIPDGVVLDRIRAKFGAENFSLTIYMPKSERGIHGHGIEQVKEEGEDTAEKEELLNPAEKKHGDEQLEKAPPSKKHQGAKRALKSPEIKKPAQEAKPDADENSEAEGEGAVVEQKPAFFAPRFFMGSALIASLIVLVVGLVRTNSPKKQ